MPNSAAISTWSSHDFRTLGFSRVLRIVSSEMNEYRPEWILGCSDTWAGWRIDCPAVLAPGLQLMPTTILKHVCRGSVRGQSRVLDRRANADSWRRARAMLVCRRHSSCRYVSQLMCSEIRPIGNTTRAAAERHGASGRTGESKQERNHRHTSQQRVHFVQFLGFRVSGF